MSDPDADDPVPHILLTVPAEYQSTIPKLSSSQKHIQKSTMATKNPPLFDSTTTEIKFRQRVMEIVPFYNGDPEILLDWLRDAGAFFAKECIPDAHQVFALRFLLTEQALDIYSAHEDLIHNFNDLRKLFLHTAGKAPLRTLASLDSISSLTFSLPPPVGNSTRLDPNLTTTTSLPPTSITFSQSADDLTQNEYRKSIITQFQEDKSLKFSGEHKQDVIKWLEKLERKFELAEISDVKKFDYLTELLEKGALTWFIERKTSLNRSWSDFVEQVKKVYDSPNRSQLAFQKLQSYNQSADQDIRSFCSVIRKLCKEYDPDMSKKMKLDFLLRSVNSTYRSEILKLKPTDADEFEKTAIDVENTFFTLKAYETNTPSTVTTYTSSPPYNYNYSAIQQSPASNYYRAQNNFRFSQRPSSNTTSRQFPSSPKHQRGHQQFSNYTSSKSPRQHNLFAYTAATPETQQPQQSIPPLMPPSQFKTPPSQVFYCQSCNQQGHSTRDCPF
ncbi:unnamed protein product [Rotaria sp. Silwood1]|nr:unnamed protein product [Rotaria sp. Silwood1]CAF3840069.1 unnamed protein product [Rotaria sp. Silwood1]CAF4067092.1 unnamed protein product [Rotaria sp. Silwood1]CAF4534331.1 unnamed protein product [Rotaria sp. Silwood1]CAF4959330.1 unnamed protein product [Rotaria sp. Silwood1]